MPLAQGASTSIDARQSNTGVMRNRPFVVLETALSDFYPVYQINAYIQEANNMTTIYSALHPNIQDYFDKAGIESCRPITRRSGMATLHDPQGRRDENELSRLTTYLCPFPFDEAVDWFIELEKETVVSNGYQDSGGNQRETHVVYVERGFHDDFTTVVNSLFGEGHRKILCYRIVCRTLISAPTIVFQIKVDVFVVIYFVKINQVNVCHLCRRLIVFAEKWYYLP